MPVRRRSSIPLDSRQFSSNRPSSRKTICRTQYPRSRYRQHWPERLSKLPAELLSHCMQRIHDGETNKSIAAWLVAQPNLGGCAHLAQETIRTYLAPLRDEVELRDRLLARHLHRRDRGRSQYRRQLHQAQRALEREAAKTAASIKIDQAYASAGETAPPSPPAAPPPNGPSAPAPPAPPVGPPPDEPSTPDSAATNEPRTKEQLEPMSFGLARPAASEEFERDMASAEAKLETALADLDVYELHAFEIRAEFQRLKRGESIERRFGVLMSESAKSSRLLHDKISALSKYELEKVKIKSKVEPGDNSLANSFQAIPSLPPNEFDRVTDNLGPAEYDRALRVSNLFKELTGLTGGDDPDGN